MVNLLATSEDAHLIIMYTKISTRNFVLACWGSAVIRKFFYIILYLVSFILEIMIFHANLKICPQLRHVAKGRGSPITPVLQGVLVHSGDVWAINVVSLCVVAPRFL